MGSKANKKLKKYDFDFYEGLDDFYDVDADFQDLTRRINSAQWENFFVTDVQMTARRQIERRRDFLKLRSELDEWAQFGDSAGW